MIQDSIEYIDHIPRKPRQNLKIQSKFILFILQSQLNMYYSTISNLLIIKLSLIWRCYSHSVSPNVYLHICRIFFLNEFIFCYLFSHHKLQKSIRYFFVLTVITAAKR